MPILWKKPDTELQNLVHDSILPTAFHVSAIAVSVNAITATASLTVTRHNTQKVLAVKSIIGSMLPLFLTFSVMI